MVEVDDGGGADAEGGSVLGDGADQGGALGADGEAVADIFDIGSGDELAGVEEQRRADAKAGVRRVGVVSGTGGFGDESGEIRQNRVGLWSVFGHWKTASPGRNREWCRTFSVNGAG